MNYSVDWNNKVRRFIRAEMVKRGVTYGDLADKLHELGCDYSKASIETKVFRGSFSASFFMQCLAALNCEELSIKEISALGNE